MFQRERCANGPELDCRTFVATLVFFLGGCCSCNDSLACRFVKTCEALDTASSTCNRDSSTAVFDRLAGSCAGVEADDVCSSYFEARSDLETEELCAETCGELESRTGFQFRPSKCQLWTREMGTQVERERARSFASGIASCSRVEAATV